MKILNIHGYKGSNENCAFTTLQDMGFEVISPVIDYDTDSPENILRNLKNIITENQINVLAGTSLGGFYAAVLSAQEKLPVILINPCLMPFVYLPRLGYEMDINPFITLFGELNNPDKQNISVIVGSEDEIIDSHDFTERLLGNERFRIVPDGRHSGATLPLKEFFKDVMNYYRREKI